tara:strand:+ start:9385 stop:10713 length:1329 start_codon:yes stop_codon:yes gene_type:complete
MTEIFRAYDIRGTYPKEINEDIAYKTGKAFVKFLNCKHIVIGYDMRTSSIKLFKSLTKGITDMGCDVTNIGLTSTPISYFANGFLKADASIMITASHNPQQYNGFKLCKDNATPIGQGTGMEEIKDLAKQDIEISETKGKLQELDIKPEYFKFLKQHCNNIKPLKVVIDAANAVSSITAKDIIDMTGCTLIPLFFELDGSFPNHEANPLKYETLKALQQKVIDEKADLGVAFDGDADRVGFVDEKGNIISGDIITGLIAKELLKQNPNSKILYDLRSSWTTKETIEQNNGIAVECRVGHAFIKRQMKEENAIFGGELSSHFYFKQNYNAECSDLAMLMILKLISEQDKSFSEIVKPIQKYFASGEINSKVSDKNKKIKQLEEKYQGGARIISWLDGITVRNTDWWFNVRPSNTEPLLRLNLEAKSKEKMELKRDEILSIIRN